MKSSSTSWLLAAFLAIIVAASSGCSRREPAIERPEIRGILLISIDTCRADYLSCYGNDRITTPRIDQLATQATVFENVIAPAPMTLPSHSTMMTGTNPTYHGVHENLEYRLGESNVTLAELLQDNGFATGAVVSAFVLDAQFGLNQGFKHYDDRFENPIGTREGAERRGDEASARATEWLADHADERFFLFLHYFDPHHEYTPPEPFASAHADNLYAGEIAYTDHCIGQLLAKLKKLNRYDSTLIIVVGDHGEMLGEHGESSHSYFVYQSAIKVPLIVKLPGQVQARRIRGLVGLVDIVPTICGLLGMDRPDQVRGTDLSGALLGQNQSLAHRYVYCESMTPTKYDASSLLGIVADGWKYIQTAQPELYDLAKDPQEVNNLIQEHPDRAKVLQEALRAMLDDVGQQGTSDSRLAPDAESRRRIESLGYVSGSTQEDFAWDEKKEDPKQFIGLHELHLSVSELIAQKKFSEAAAVCRRMIEEHPNVVVAYERLADIANEQGDQDAVAESWSQVLERKPNHATAHSNLGVALAALGKHSQAMEHYREALKLRPDFAPAYHNLAVMLLASGKIDEAIDQWRQAVRLNPNYAEAHAKLGRALADRREYEPALEHLQRALACKPDYVAAQIGLADTLLFQGRVADAILQYQRALELDPNSSDAHNNLGNALLRQQKPDEAMYHFQEALRSNADYAMAHYNVAVLSQSRGDLDKALAHYREALRIKPDWLVPMSAAAWILATNPHASSRDPVEAVRLAEHAARLSNHQEATILDTLAAAYAAAGRFDHAVQTARTALQRAQATGREAQARQISARLELYQHMKTYVQPPLSGTPRID